MFRALARFFVVLISFWAIAVALKWSINLALVIGGLVGFALAFYGWWTDKTEAYTGRELAAKPFASKLPQSVADATTTSIALRGDDSYSQRVVGTKAYSANFAELLDYAGLSDGDTLEVQSALVAEPSNRYSRHAVAVTCGGLILGYIPEFESESLFRFLMSNRGIARVNSNIIFDVAGEQSRVELDLIRPYEIVKGV